jgi:uncharacterized protein DUF6298
VRRIGLGLALAAACAGGESGGSGTPLPPQRPAALGPLRVDSVNPRYFSDGQGHVVYLTGSHTWSNFQDNGTSDPPPAFDYAAYLDFLVRNNHNFFRLWSWEQARWTAETDSDYWFSPLPYQRTGPDTALDGKLRFDLTKLNPAYFARLRDRVQQAGARGIYVSVMLFDGWSIEDKDLGHRNPWRGHPFNAANNVNGLDGDPNADGEGQEIHTLAIPAVTAVQDAYVRAVVDAVNDLDNVLYEISNESPAGSEAWQSHMIDLVKTYEATKPRRHPVGMTVEYPGGHNAELFASAADWISPNDSGGVYRTDPWPADGRKVIVWDSDHMGTETTTPAWAWQSFLRGMNPIFMDTYDGQATGVGARPSFDPNDPRWVQLRRDLGYTLAYAARLPLRDMRPRGELASTHYCLANAAPVGEYLAYAPAGSVSLDLSASAGSLRFEWFAPASGETYTGGTVAGGAIRNFTAPFGGAAVLYVFSPHP